MSALGRLWNLLDAGDRIRLAALCAMMVAGAGFEALGVGAIIPFISAVTDPERVLSDPRAAPLLDAAGIDDRNALLLGASAALVALFALKSGYLAFFYHAVLRFSFGRYVSLSRQLLRAYLQAPYTFHLQRNTAVLLKNVSDTTQQFASGFLLSLIVTVGESLVLITLALLLFVLEPWATLGALVLLSVPAVILYLPTRWRMRAAGERRETSRAAVNQWVNQALGGIREIKLQGREDFFLERFTEQAQAFAAAWRSFTYLNQFARFFVDSLAAMGLAAVVAVVVLRGDGVAALLPVVGMFGVAAMRLTPSVNRITTGVNSLRFFRSAVDVLAQELAAARVAEAPSGRPASAAAPRLVFEKELVVAEVSYRYPGAAGLALDGVSLVVPRGQRVGLVGATGAGKSTLVDVVLALLSPCAGQVRVDGTDLRENLEAWQRRIGYVPQAIYLCDDTLRRNVAFGLPDAEIDDARVRAVLETAQLGDFLGAARAGLDTEIGERGTRLSGGERQRLGIARALYHDPELLVLDEATSALDPATEAAIGRVLETLRGRSTVLVVAHRLAMVRSCDRIYVLREGRVCETGRYDELLARSGEFQRLTGRTA